MAETHKKPEMRGIMTYMRDKTHIVIWALVFSFVGFIIFSWGMDILGVSAPTNQGILAEVNGTEISYQDFKIRMGNQINLIRQQLGTSPDVQDTRRLQDQVFNDMVNDILIGDAIEEMGLFATNEEIIQEVRMRPRSEFLNRPELRNEDGAFDVGKYNIFLSQLSTNDYILLEADARIQIPQRKLQDLLTSTIRITEEEIKQAYLHQEQHVEVEYILAESNLFADATINITDREIEDYYQAHQENYFEEETRQLRYIIFYLNPTSSDSAAIDLQIDEALLKANNQEDFTDLAQEYSGADGDLGMFSKGTMMAEIENAVFSDGTEEGDILGPIDSPLGKHIIKIEKLVKSNGSIDSVHAIHILFTYTYSAATEDMVETTARDFEFRAKDEGYDKVASELGFTILQTIPFRRFGFIPGFGVIPEVE
ncbi:SurA N-terminal domain-containing protein, partial [candidate division KSB1 bacterium]|nr:SurA N-terminal domain-containing protein [candidate division KSB1 bacterium]